MFWWLILIFVFPACDLMNYSGDIGQETRAALGATQTGLAQVIAGLTQSAGGSATASLQPPAAQSPDAQATLAPVDATPSPQSAAPTGQAQAAIDPDERLLKSARILLFEDMSASRHIRYVKEALDREGYFYQDVGSAKGWFKSMLLSPVEWDLVIAAAEARRDFGGEFFAYIDDQVERGAGAIIEYYDVDAAPYGKIKPLLDRCGVEFQSDWFEPDMRVFFWLAPEHPLFNQPNQIPNSLRNAEQLWGGDIGDLMQLKSRVGQPVGDSVILAGTNSAWKSDHGTLLSCLNGRVILQTFSSHEYYYNDMLALWQNYIYQSLKAHFAYTQASVPTPAITVTPAETDEPISPPETPGPAYSQEYSCGGLLRARILDAPLFQKDLFEHHAEGVFLIVRLQLVNDTRYPIFIWDEDYFVEGLVDGRPVTYSPNQAATGYLFIESPNNLYQGLIPAEKTWRTRLAFDVDPEGESWVLTLRPGSEFDEQVCQVKIPLYR